MGAAAAVLYAAEDPLVAGLVLDSPFADLDDTIVHVIGELLPRPAIWPVLPTLIFRTQRSPKTIAADVLEMRPSAAECGCCCGRLCGALSCAAVRRWVARVAGYDVNSAEAARPEEAAVRLLWLLLLLLSLLLCRPILTLSHRPVQSGLESGRIY